MSKLFTCIWHHLYNVNVCQCEDQEPWPMGCASGLPCATISRPLWKKTAPMLLEISRVLVSRLWEFRENNELINMKLKADCYACINITIVGFAIASSKLYSRKTKILSVGWTTYCIIDIELGSPDVVILYRDHILHMNSWLLFHA